MIQAGKHKNWKCAQGHTYQSTVPIQGIMCGKCAKNASVAKKDLWMKPDLDSPP